MIPELSPPIEAIERRHLGLADGLIARAEAHDLPRDVEGKVRSHPDWTAYGVPLETAEAGLAARPLPMPEYIKEAIERRVRLSRARFDPPPRPGQIVRVARLPDGHEARLGAALGSPLHVLLDGPAPEAGPGLWYGWLCAGETDYAGWFDFVLQDGEDEPFEPDAAMVQVWNPVHVPEGVLGPVEAQLSPARLAAVRALAADCLTAEAGPETPPLPGRVALRRAGDFWVATGTPLGGESDPRHRYQAVYAQAADALRLSSALVQEDAAEARGRSWRLREWFRGLAGRVPDLSPAPLAAPMAAGGPADTGALRWTEGGLRLELAGDPPRLGMVNESDQAAVVFVFRTDGLPLDRYDLRPAGRLDLDILSEDAARLRAEKGGQALDLELPQGD